MDGNNAISQPRTVGLRHIELGHIPESGVQVRFEQLHCKVRKCLYRLAYRSELSSLNLHSVYEFCGAIN